MFSLSKLYETDDENEFTLGQRIVHNIVSNVCPVIVFGLAFWAFRTFVWDQPLIVNWK